jgi:hypothetical protein
MRKTSKKVLTVATVAAMMTTMVAPAFAANGDFYDNSTNTPYNALSYQTNATVFNAMIMGLILHPDTFVFENNNQEYNYSKMLTAINTQMALGKTVGDAFTMAKADPANVDVKGTTAAVAQSISAVNGTLTVTFDKAVTVAPKATDFVVKKDGVAVTLTDANVTLSAGKVAIQVPTVAATAVDQTVVYSVSYKTGNEIAANVTVLKAVTDPQVAIVAAAETAVNAYETATITTNADITPTALLKTTANTAVAAVTDATTNTAFTTRISAKQTAITTQLTAVVAAVNAANTSGSQAQLLAALKPFFLNVNDASIVAYDAQLNGNQTTVAQIQTIIDAVQASIVAANDTAAVNAATNQIQLLAALQAGVQNGTFKNVRESLIVQYDGAIRAIVPIPPSTVASTVQIQAAITAANKAVDDAAVLAVTNAGIAVTNAEATPTASLIAAAQTLVTALPADVAPATTKATLNARLIAIGPVAPVLAAKALNDTYLLNTALQASVYKNVNTALIATYLGTIAPTDITVTLIQKRIDDANTADAAATALANYNAANTAVGTAEVGPLTSAHVAAAQVLVTALPADISPAKAKALLQTRLDVVNALIAVNAAYNAGDATDASVFASLQANATVLGITGLNAPYASFYRVSLTGVQVAKADVSLVITTVNAARLTAAGDAVALADATPGITAAKVATAQALVTVLPADVAPAKDKALLQTRLDVVNALLAINTAMSATGATDTTVLTALQANATVLGLTNVNAPYASSYRTALTTDLTLRDLASEVKGIITTVNTNAAIAADTSVGTAETAITAAKVATAQALVTTMPTLTPNTVKAALQTRLDVVNALLAIDTAMNVSGATDASVYSVLQANATVLGLTGTHALNPNLAYKTALTATLTNRDLASEVVAIVDSVNSPVGAMTALKTPGVDAATELALIKAKTLNLTNVVDANAGAYFADRAAFATAANLNTSDVQKVVNAVNALVLLNSATTAVNENTALLSFVVNVNDATSTTYINLSSAAKLEEAQLILVAKGSTPYANIAAVQAAITAQDGLRTSFLQGVNGATTISQMNVALDAAQLPTFQALAPEVKLAKAEQVLNALNAIPFVSPATHGSFTTITAIQQAAGL